MIPEQDSVERAICRLGGDCYSYQSLQNAKLSEKNGVVLLYQDRTPNVVVFHLKDGRKYSIERESPILGARFFYDVVGVSDLSGLSLWNVDTLPRMVRELPNSEGFGNKRRSAVHKKSGTIATLDAEKKILHLCKKDGTIEHLQIDDLPKEMVRFLLVGSCLIVVSMQEVWSYDLESREPHSRAFTGFIRVRTDGEQLVVYEQKYQDPGTFFVLDPRTLQEKCHFKPEAVGFSSFQISENQLNVATDIKGAALLQRYDLKTGWIERSLKVVAQGIDDERFIKFQGDFAVIAFKKRIEFWNIVTGKRIHGIKRSREIYRLKFGISPFPYVAAMLKGGKVLLWHEKVGARSEMEDLIAKVQSLSLNTAEERKKAMSIWPQCAPGVFITCLEKREEISWVYKPESVLVLRELLPLYLMELAKRLPDDPNLSSHFWQTVQAYTATLDKDAKRELLLLVRVITDKIGAVFATVRLLFGDEVGIPLFAERMEEVFPDATERTWAYEQLSQNSGVR
jgi:hypothetical protein